MKEFWIWYDTKNGEHVFVLLTGWHRLVWWLFCHSWRCIRFCIQLNSYPEDFLQEEEESPCETCLRWEECNGVDKDNCPMF